MEFTFPKGSKLIREDGAEESLEGVSFTLREQTKRDRILATKNAQSRRTDPGTELVRLAFTSFRGEPVKQPFAAYGDMNIIAEQFVDVCWFEVNGIIPREEGADSDPLEATGKTPTGGK